MNRTFLVLAAATGLVMGAGAVQAQAPRGDSATLQHRMLAQAPGRDRDDVKRDRDDHTRGLGDRDRDDMRHGDRDDMRHGDRDDARKPDRDDRTTGFGDRDDKKKHDRDEK
jgi:hypothetical protein